MTDHTEANALAVAHMGLVKHIACKVAAVLPSSVERDDLEGAGYIGLVQASRSYDETYNVTFGAYARQRIRGEIFDWLRCMDWVPRRERARLKREVIPVPVRMVSLEAELGNPDRADHVLTLRKIIASQHPGPDRNLDAYDFWQAPLPGVSEKELRILQMYYRDRMNMKQIGAVFGFSESNTCKILAGIRARHAS